MLNCAVSSLEDSPIYYLLLRTVASYLHILKPVRMRVERRGRF